VASTEQALRNVAVAEGAGADGVFLFTHGAGADYEISDERLLDIYQVAAEAFPQFWIGVNCLGLLPDELFEVISANAMGVWTDNAMIREESGEQIWPHEVLRIQRRRGWQGLYFGGVAFKYQRPVEDLAQAAGIACHYMDVVTTSGPATGRPADLAKIRMMKESMGDFPLAIASGITPENVHAYLDVADCFLVATGISKTFEELEPPRVRLLVEKVRYGRKPEGPS